MNLKEVVTKNQKNKKSEKCQFAWANPEMLSFFNFFLQEYQSEKSPIFDSQGSTKKKQENS